VEKFGEIVLERILLFLLNSIILRCVFVTCHEKCSYQIMQNGYKEIMEPGGCIKL